MNEENPNQLGKRILILSPHPDDEVVGCCTMISRAQEEGAKIFILHLTHGCPPKEIIWPWKRPTYTKRISTRRHEAECVAEELGIEIIGFGDRPARTLWSHLSEAKQDVQDALKEFEIDQIWVPAYEGGNADHDGLNGMVSFLATDELSILEFAEYNFYAGKVHSQTFPTLHGKEKIITLTEEEVAEKQRYLDMYKSEKQNLNYVETEHESFRPIANYDYTKLAHEGTLWYKRYDWVPFSHPGVDRTKPEDVCNAISFFAS